MARRAPLVDSMAAMSAGASMGQKPTSELSMGTAPCTSNTLSITSTTALRADTCTDHVTVSRHLMSL